MNNNPNTQELAAAYADMDAAWKQVDDAWNACEPTIRTTPEAGLWREFMPLWEKWKGDAREIIAIQKQRDDLQANGANANDPLVISLEFQFRKMNMDSDINFSAAESKLAEIVSRNEQAANSAAKDSTDTRKALSSAVAVGFLSTVVLGMVVTRNVVHNIEQLHNSSQPSAPDANDIRAVLDSVSQLADHLEKSTRNAQAQFQNLQDTVAEKLAQFMIEEQRRIATESERERERQSNYKLN